MSIWTSIFAGLIGVNVYWSIKFAKPLWDGSTESQDLNTKMVRQIVMLKAEMHAVIAMILMVATAVEVN